VQLNCAGVTDIGRKRAANEDFFATDAALGICVVADGLGGHVAGRVASETAVGSFMEVAASERAADPLVMLRRAARGANAAILEKVAADSYLRGMGTTLAALCLRGSSAVLAHLGDSRIYLQRGPALHPLTMDHSYVCELVFRRRIDAETARRHPNRHVILRALGIEPASEPDLVALQAQPGDLFLLCTDGVHGQVSDEEIRALLLAAGDDLEPAARSIIERANAHGGFDNSTVILARVLAG
jgi:PPM family protein phosphatase